MDSLKILNCYTNATDEVCAAAQEFCQDNVLVPVVGDVDVYDVRAPSDDPYPPDITPLLTNKEFMCVYKPFVRCSRVHRW